MSDRQISRCRHQCLVITETIAGYTEHCRESDGSWLHNNTAGQYNQRLIVQCLDCGHCRVYWRGERRNPTWLRAALDELGIPFEG